MYTSDNNYLVEISREISKENLEILVNSTEEGAPFLSINLAEKFSASNLFILIYDKEKSLLGGICGRIRNNKKPFKYVASTLWLDSGPLSIVKDNKKANEIKKIILIETLRVAKKSGVILVYTSHWTREKNKSLYIDCNYDVLEYGTFINDLLLNESEIFGNFKSENRRAIKKAIKSNVHTLHLRNEEAIQYINDFQLLRKKTQDRALKRNKSASMQLKSDRFLLQIFKNKNIETVLSLAFVKDKMVSGALLVGGGKTIYYYIGGSDIELNLKYRTSNFLHFEIMKYAKNNGYMFYDFGGSPINPETTDPAYGIFRFKKNYGGEFKIFFGGVYEIKRFRSKLLKIILKNKLLLRMSKNFFRN